MNINKNTELYPFSHILDSFFNTRGKNIEGFNAISSLGSKHYQEKNYYEDKNQLKLELPLPGYSNDELELKFDNGLLSLEAKVDSELNEKALVLKKSSFKYKFQVPESCDISKLNAKLQNGILEVHLPKKKLPEPKKIEIC